MSRKNVNSVLGQQQKNAKIKGAKIIS